MAFPADTYSDAVYLGITASNQLHTILNGDSTTEITVEDGSKIPSVRKAYTNSLFFLSPQPWSIGQYETVYNQLRAFIEPTGITTWWFSKTATVSTPILMSTTPHEDTNWTLWNATNNSVYETQKRLAAEAGLNMVGSFLLGATVATTDDVVFYETDGKYYGWGSALPKVVSAGSTPETAGGIGVGAWSDKTDLTVRGELAALNGAHLAGNATFYIEDVLVANVTNIPDKAIVIVRTRNGNTDGGGIFEYWSGSTLTVDNGIIFTPTTGSGRLVRKGYTVLGFNGDIDVCWFGADRTGATDTSSHIQATINYVRDLVITGNNPFANTSIVVPAGTYKCLSTITSHPWIKIKSKGNVKFDFSTSTVSTNGLIIHNEFTQVLPNGILNRKAACLSGDEGTINIVGQGRDGISTAIGLQIGNSATGYTQFGNTLITGVAISGWAKNIQPYRFNSYLVTFRDCDFGFSGINVAFPDEVLSDSGERIAFDNCNFVASQYVFSHAADRWDVNCLNCSFDFNGSLLKLWDTAIWADYKFTACYIEGIDNYIVEGGTAGTQCRVSLNATTILPSKWRRTDVDSSMGRQLFNTSSAMTVSVDDIRILTTMRPYLEDGYLFNTNADILQMTRIAKTSYLTVPTQQHVINRDFNLQLNADGTLAGALTAWTRVAGFVNIGTNAIATVSGKKVLQIVGTTTGSAISFESTQSSPAKPGDRFICNVALQSTISSGTLIVRAGVQFYDAAGTSLGIFPSFRDYDFSAALADTTLPNYASGAARYMDTGAFVAVAPAGAVSAKGYFIFLGWTGTINVSRMRVWNSN